MKRSDFLRGLSVFPFLPLSASAPWRPPGPLLPPRLRVGDAVSLVAPAGPVDEDRVLQAVNNLERIGLRAKPGDNILARHGHNAGTDRQRLADLHAAFRDRETRAVWCIRGGDGSYRLLPQIDYQLVAENPKIVIGYSDVTALLQAFHRETGLVGFHGPIAASSTEDWRNFRTNMEAVIMEAGLGHVVKGSEATETLVDGRAEGVLAGGNLTLLAALAGTPHALDATDKLVFLEDVGEAPRRIDRMLTTLKQACKLDRAKGILLGEWIDCECDLDPDDETRCEGNSLTLRQVLDDHFADFAGPVLYRFPFGHGDRLCTFPVGVKARLDAEKRTVEILERTTA